MADEQKPPDTPVDQPLNVTSTVGNIGNIIGIILPQPIDISQVLGVLDNASNLTTTDAQYVQIKPALQKAVSDLKTYLQRQDTQISSLTNQITSLQTQNQTLQGQVNDLTNQVAALNAQITQLKAQIAAAPKTALPLDVAQSFKSVVDQIQSAARNTPGATTTLSTMQIAVKALVNVQPGATAGAPSQALLVFPDPSQLPDPNHLSTVTMNFAGIPNVKPAPPPATGPVPTGSTPGTQRQSAPEPGVGTGHQPIAPPAQPSEQFAQDQAHSLAERTGAVQGSEGT